MDDETINKLLRRDAIIPPLSSLSKFDLIQAISAYRNALSWYRDKYRNDKDAWVGKVLACFWDDFADDRYTKEFKDG